MINSVKIKKAEMVLPCVEFEKNLNFFVDELRFRVDSIFPADDPRIALISGYGLRLRLERTDFENNENLSIRINCDSSEKVDPLVAPNGVTIEFFQCEPNPAIPKLKSSLVINRRSENADWIEGRAGMRYRDLIPNRLGGYMIASHIHIPDAGPVPDYVHFHKVQFQMIYCYKGWVKVVYEDQGEPFVMNAGDCVLQPPEIRHRVLECSKNLEVIELSVPAEHITYAEHEMTLPNAKIDREREFCGQQFVRHVASDAVWGTGKADGFEMRDTGIENATRGMASARVVRARGEIIEQAFQNEAEVSFVFVLKGSMDLKIGAAKRESLSAGDSFVIPADENYSYSDWSGDLEILEVRLP